MDGLLNLLPLYTESVEGEHNLGQFLETCRAHQSFGELVANEIDLNHAVGVINAKLNNPDSRTEGALLLDVVITQCGTDTFTSNCVLWTQQVMRLLHGPSKVNVGPTACKVLGKLLAFSSQFPELSRQLSTTVISQLVALLCEPEFLQKASITVHVLECLKTCMKYYGNPCGTVKGTIERSLLSLIDWDEMATDPSLRATWAACMAQLPSVGGSGSQGAQHRSNWIEFCVQLVDSIHGTINGMFRNIEELKTQEASSNPLKLPALQHKNPMVLLHDQQRRFINLCAALVLLLTEPFPVAKNVPIDRLLAMISRLLALNSKSLSKTARANFEQLTLASIIPDLQSSVLDVLKSLVAVCRSQLLTRATTVMNLFVQVLQWTFTPLDRRRVGVERPYGKLRSQVYRNLCLWVAASRSACGLGKCVDVLFSQLLSDILVHRDTVQLLTVNPPSNGKTTKKGKKKMDTPGVILQKDDLKANADVCQMALQCLSTILLCCGPRIKPTIHKEVQEIVLSILVEIMNGAELNTILPYNDPRCRAGLYQLLEKLVLCPSPQWPAPLNYASAVLNNGLNDPNLEVSTRCIEALASIQSIVRPRGPTLNFAMEMKQLRSIQQEAPLLNGWAAKMVEPSLPTSAPSQPAPAAMSIEKPPVVAIDQLSTPPRRQFAPNSVESTVEIRQPETSPPPSKRLSLTKTNGEHNDDFLTPPMGVTTISSESPVKSPRVMTRKEALKVLASAMPPQSAKEQSPNPPKTKQTKNKASPARKRPLDDSKPTAEPLQEKMETEETDNGVDELDDTLDDMLASFHDVPA
ncbi:hypothetical protein DAPPUDRAFT_303887 [Daphnia pulex]|uniref:Pre-rRNA-processing protein RIX1 N-terminal domain-containing protein n=1 Tax=Daphnia pulex TaxID=6669 RepID=E9GIS6_DAPPU|nr:hypothetical protein DAPPUDRAFT_303887 [Daphnia pulex]|eukprot:EFX80838.1 hypothetical protein DAPPUDRAFT_303887 [Daphnia pulex]